MHHQSTPQKIIQQGISQILIDRFWVKVNKDGPIPEHRPELGPCWVWKAYTNACGYGVISTPIGNIGAHQLAWLIAENIIPEGECVLHKCDLPRCVRDSHMWCGTHRQNMEDMAQKCRQGLRKLEPAQVIEIRQRYSTGRETLDQLGKAFSVSFALIGHIVNYRRWKHLE